jgi:CrcB protein
VPSPTKRATGPGPAPVPVLRMVAIAAGGALGTLARYELSQAVVVSANGFPWATFAVNVAGSLLLGVIITVVAERWPPTRYALPFAAIGFCGGFTTFSTLMVEAVRRAQDGYPALGVVYLLASVVAGVVAAVLGVLLARSRRGGTSDLLSTDRDSEFDTHPDTHPEPEQRTTP